MIQFTCPSCKSACSVDDKFARRKIKCPKCGARVIHVRDSQVELLTAGSALPAAAPAAEAPPGEATPVATAAVPHAVGEFVRQSESRQNTLIVAGLGGFFAVLLSLLGMWMGKPLLAATPIGIALTAAAVWLWMRKKKLEAKARSLERPKGTVGEATEPLPKP